MCYCVSQSTSNSPIYQFAAAVGSQKSKFVYAGNTHITLIFSSLGLPADKLSSPEARKACPMLRDLSPEDVEDIYPKILFPLVKEDSESPNRCDEDGRYFLRTDCILKVSGSRTIRDGTPLISFMTS